MNAVEHARLRLTQAETPQATLAKWDALIQALQSYGSAVVAYSGGVDSSLLAYAAALALGERMIAVTIESTLESAEAIGNAAGFAAAHAIPHAIIACDPLEDPALRANPPDRCYLCKRNILGRLHDYALRGGYAVTLEGQNDDDRRDYRPGARAVAETATLSPLAEQRLTKSEIRLLARALGLEVWNRPSAPCLATRIPYGVAITVEALQRIEQAEGFLRGLGFTGARVRHHQQLARIEAPPEQLPALFEQRSEIAAHFKHIGYTYITLDLQGYRMGSLNETLQPPP